MKQVLVFGKMELPLCDYTQYKVRSVIRFLAAAGWTKAAIHKELKRVYGTDVNDNNNGWSLGETIRRGEDRCEHDLPIA